MMLVIVSMAADCRQVARAPVRRAVKNVGGGCVAGSRSLGCRRGPARHHDGQPTRAGHAGAQLRAHHEEIFQFRYAPDCGGPQPYRY